jgi:hypothetical protein
MKLEAQAVLKSGTRQLSFNVPTGEYIPVTLVPFMILAAIGGVAPASRDRLSSDELHVATQKVIGDAQEYQHTRRISDEAFGNCIARLNADMEARPERDLKRAYKLPRAEALAIVERGRTFLLACLQQAAGR